MMHAFAAPPQPSSKPPRPAPDPEPDPVASVPEVGPDSDVAAVPRLHTARAELVLADHSARPLGEVLAGYDLMTAFATALEAADGDHEHVGIALDLQPLGWWERNRWRKDIRRAASTDASRVTGIAQILKDAWDSPQGGRSRPRVEIADGDRMQQWADHADLRAQYARHETFETVFRFQLLVRATATSKERARSLRDRTVAVFDRIAGRNRLKVRRPRWPQLASAFDQRWLREQFAPRRGQYLTLSDAQALLTPPTRRCVARNVVRTLGSFAPPPASLPTYDYQPGVLPLGTVGVGPNKRLVGVPIDDTLFSVKGGRTGYGKSETMIGEALHIALTLTDAVTLIDPHFDAIRKILPYLLAHTPDRVETLSFHKPASGIARNAHVLTWNPVSMVGATRDDLDDKRGVLLDAFRVAAGWTSHTNRAPTIMQHAVTALLEIGLALQDRPDLQPTVFTLNTILGNEEWRERALEFVSVPTREYFEQRFASLPADAITPITNIVDQFRGSDMIAGILGSPESAWNLRESMDAGRIVLLSPAGPDKRATELIANFLMGEHVRAFKSRVDLAEADRRPVWSWFDEAQIYDRGGAGAAMQQILRECRKYGSHAQFLTQSIGAFSDGLRDALATNAGTTITFAVGADTAGETAAEFASPSVTPAHIQNLPKHQFLVSVTLNGVRHPPFLARSMRVDELWPVPDEPAEPAGTDARYRRVGDVLDNLDTLDARIGAELRARARTNVEGPTSAPRSARGGDPRRRNL